MRAFVKTVIQYSAAISLFAALSLPATAQVVLLDRIAAIVDDDVVMASELEERVGSIYQRLQASGTEAPPKEVLVPQVLERLIIERLQLNMGMRAGIRISDAEINQSLTRLAQAQGLTREQLVEKAHKEGINLAQLRSELRNEMTVQRVQETQVNRRIRITSQEVDNFLGSEEGRFWSSPDVRIGHILLRLSAGASREDVATITNKATELHSQLQQGTDFKKLAIANSSGQHALDGGDLGWKKAAQLPGVFTKALETLEPNQISDPIRSDAGIHILKLYERRGGGEQLIQQSKVRHILVKPNEIRTEEDAKQMLLDMRKDIVGGADFAVLAKEHSEDIGSALSGGDLGWSLPGQFVPQFEQTMKQTEVGAISEPFRSQFGWHMLQVTERRQEDFSEDIKRRQAENILRNRKFEEELQIWTQEIRDEAFVEIKV